MASFQSFEDIKSWQAGRALTRGVYHVTAQAPFMHDDALVDQIRRAAVSITSSIAEGFERDRDPQFIQSLREAKGAAGEVRSQLYVAFDEGYIDQATFDALYGRATDTLRLLRGLIRYIQAKEPVH